MPASPLTSLCMIVRDGGSSILKTLESVVGASIADEIVIVDTGSVDDTIKLIIDFAKNHKDLKWNVAGGVPSDWFAPGGVCRSCRGFGEEDDESDCLRCGGSGIKPGDGKTLLTHFDAARNTSFKMATGKWVGWADCDELFLSSTPLKEYITNLPDFTNAITCAKTCYPYNSDKPPLELNSIRFVLNNAGWQWTSRIHEYLINTSQLSKPVDCKTLETQHHPSGPWPNRSRDVAVIKHILQEDGPNFRLLMYLVSILTDEGYLGQADKYTSKLFYASNTPLDMYDAGIVIGNLRRRQGETLEAIRVYTDAYKLSPNSPDAPFLLADAFFVINKEKAVEWYDKALRTIQVESPRIMSNLGLAAISRKFKEIGIL